MDIVIKSPNGKVINRNNISHLDIHTIGYLSITQDKDSKLTIYHDAINDYTYKRVEDTLIIDGNKREWG